jgi:hypothetical protein
MGISGVQDKIAGASAGRSQIEVIATGRDSWGFDYAPGEVNERSGERQAASDRPMADGEHEFNRHNPAAGVNRLWPEGWLRRCGLRV